MKDLSIELTIAIAEACDWEQVNFCEGFIWLQTNIIKNVELLSLDTIHEIEKALGLHDRDNLKKRVDWINTLREIVSVRCPVNKIGSPIISDIDIMTASAEERLLAIIKLIKFKQ